MPENLLEPSFLIIDFPYLANILFISKITDLYMETKYFNWVSIDVVTHRNRLYRAMYVT